MATTAQQIFDIVMALSDEIDDTGVINPTNTASYAVRTPKILTAYIYELYGSGLAFTPSIITSLADVMPTSDNVSLGLMPFALGMELFKEENEDMYRQCEKQYNKLKDTFIKRQPATEEAVIDVYSGEE